MKLLIVNPNSTQAMNVLIQESIPSKRSAGANVVCPSSGPPAIETVEDEIAAVEGMIELISNLGSEVNNYDALVVACYGDPGMEEMASIVEIPVVGIAKISMSVAFAISDSVGLIVALSSAIPIMSRLATKYGHDLAPEAIEASGVAVLEMLNNPDSSYPAILAVATELKRKGVDTVCLGCASMGQFARRLQVDTGLTVIDAIGVTEGALWATQRASSLR